MAAVNFIAMPCVAKFVPALTTLSMLGLKPYNFSARFASVVEFYALRFSLLSNTRNPHILVWLGLEYSA